MAKLFLNFMTLSLVLISGVTLTSCNEDKHTGVAPTLGDQRQLDPKAVYDAKTGVKLDTRFLPPTFAHKAIYRPETEPIVVVGEVVDAWCYASQTMGAGHGRVHQACAVACVGGGVTPGILDDKGLLWLCVKHKAYTGCKELLFPFVARRVKVSGWAAHKGGCNVLKVDKVELETPTSTSGSTPIPTSTAVKKDK